MLKIIAISLITIFLSVTLKQKSSEFALIVSCCGGLLVLFVSFEYVSDLISFYMSLSDKVGIDNDIIKIALKIVFIGILTEFVSEIAIDFGNSVISSKVVFGGRVVICLIMLPVIKDLVSLLFSFY